MLKIRYKIHIAELILMNRILILQPQSKKCFYTNKLKAMCTVVNSMVIITSNAVPTIFNIQNIQLTI